MTSRSSGVARGVGANEDSGLGRTAEPVRNLAGVDDELVPVGRKYALREPESDQALLTWIE